MRFSWSYSPNTGPGRLSFRRFAGALCGGAAARFAAAVFAFVPLAAPLGAGAQRPAPELPGSPGGWQLCNLTSYVIEAAAGHYEGQGVTVEGWTRLRPGSCEVALSAPLEPGVHYLFARSSSAHRGGRKVWGGDTSYCVDTTGSFSVESPADCSSMGLAARRFRPVLVEDAAAWTTTFTELEDYDLDTAAAAGVQRLLNEANVYEGNIDGFIGRRTRAAIRQFLSENDLDAETSDAELVDVLEQIAREKGREVGLTLCNRTRERIWTAIARRKGEGWESRGWWQLESGGCARAVDEALLATPHFVFAEMEDEAGSRELKGATDLFCVSRGRFAIAGRNDCEASAYRTVSFKATKPAEDGRLTYEFFERDFEEAGG